MTVIIRNCSKSVAVIVLKWNDENSNDGIMKTTRTLKLRPTPIIIITCTLIDVAIPADRNVVQKDVEKKLKYKSLGIEIERMWNLKCTIISVIIGATGIVTRGLKKNLQTIPGTHSIDFLQKTAILGTSHILRKALQCET